VLGCEGLGGCGGPITREHLATHALLGPTVRVQVGTQRTPAVETSFKKLTANILCWDHNSELGRTADAVALRLYRHLKASHSPLKLPDSRILRPPVGRRVSGVNFGCWLCKTHCNYMIVLGMKPDPAYIRYAFLHPPGKPIYFYLAGGLGDTLRLADGRDPVVSWQQLLSDDQPDFDGFLISLAGFPVAVATAPIRRNGLQMIDRIRVVEWPTSLGLFRIVFDWSGEPALPTLVET